MLRAAVTLLISALGAQPVLPAAAPDLSGTWVLDTFDSVDLTKVSFIPPAGGSGANGERAPNGGGSRRRGGGFGGFGGGFGGGGSGERTRQSAPALTAEERTRMKALAGDLKAGWARIILSEHDQTLVINDARDRTYFLKTDGDAADNHVGELTLSSVTRPEGDRFVTDWTISSRFTVEYAYALVTNGRQLVIRVGYKGSPDAQDLRQFDPRVYLLYTRSGS